MKQIIKIEESTTFLSTAVEIWNVEDRDVEGKFEEIINNIKTEYNLYETYEEYKKVMKKIYQKENPSYEEYEEDIKMYGPLIKRLTPTEVFVSIDNDLVIRVKIVDCTEEHTRIEIA